MLINHVPGEECRIAIVENGRLEEFYQERASSESHVGNIYKGRVVGIEPSIQAAFVDFGLGRNGFLHVSDLHPKYFPGDAREESERIGQKTPRRDRPPIQRCLKRGQEILVQVLKEGIGTKGPTLTSYLSIPGRFLVMLPDMERLGVSRKIEDDEARHEIRKILDELNPPQGFGFIIRTAGIDRNKTDLKRDLAYLQRLWKAISQRMESTSGVGELYTESDLVIRTIRDVFSTNIERIIVDEESAAHRAHHFLAIASPRSGSKVLEYRDPIPLFHRYNIERQIDNINERRVALPSGGYLVIDSTEALVAIDVNSGSARDASDPEATAYKTNTEAVDEICRQLRLRDLGGVIVNDLIDMRKPQHRRTIEQRMRNNLKEDRARTRVVAISQFGLLEMTRQRMRPSLKSSIYIECPGCKGVGHVKSPESVVLEAMRRLALAMQRPEVARLDLTVSPDVAFHLLNRKRSSLVKLEESLGKPVLVRVGGATLDHVQLDGFDSRGNAVNLESVGRFAEPTLIEIQNDAIGFEEFGIQEEDVEAVISEGADRTVTDASAPIASEDDAEAGTETETISPDPLEGAGVVTAASEPGPMPSPTTAEGRPRRRRRRRGRGRGGQQVVVGAPPLGAGPGKISAQGLAATGSTEPGPAPTPPTQTAPNTTSSRGPATPIKPPAINPAANPNDPLQPPKRSRRRRRRGRGKGDLKPINAGEAKPTAPNPQAANPPVTPSAVRVPTMNPPMPRAAVAPTATTLVTPINQGKTKRRRRWPRDPRKERYPSGIITGKAVTGDSTLSVSGDEPESDPSSDSPN
jgi:ribonuclease E